MSNAATLESLWRYPVKSMAGEELDEAQVTPRGLLGDRVYALVDGRNKAGTARNLRGILDCRARFATPPRPDDRRPPAVDIALPDGRTVSSEDTDCAGILSEFHGHDVTLHASPPAGLALEFSAGTLAGKHASTTEIPIASGAPPGTFVDYATIHILTTSTLARLSEAYPSGCFDVRRFRPNIVMRTAEPGFVENAWLGRTLALGEEVTLQVTIPCPRCVIPTLPQADLPKDPGILRAIAQHNRQDLGDFGALPCVGVCADVLTPGVIRRHDTVRILD
ncbi:MAG: MOSC domain-containing protein [Planctomycetota bacterium]